MVVDDYGDEMEPTVEEAPRKMGTADKLLAMVQSQNLVKDLKLDAETLASLAAKVCEEFEIDWQSTKPWRERNDEAMKLAMMVSETKTYPFDNASNVKYPLVTLGAYQFNARAYPAIVAPDRVVKCKTRGRDPEGKKAARADRVSEHMSDQLLTEMGEWDEDTDRLLTQLPIEGTRFRKVYYDPATGKNKTRNLSGERVVVNMGARSLDDVPRITERLFLYPYEVEERIRDGRYIEFDYKGTQTEDQSKERETGGETADEDPDGPLLFLEQHRLYDLDDDGYPEPYICTVHKASQKVVRITANFTEKTVRANEAREVVSVRRRDYYVKYGFLPNPEGGFYDVGLGWFLKDTNESINTTLNQMFDAAHLSLMQGGFIGAGAGFKDRKISLSKGEWRVIPSAGNLGQNIVPIKYDGPSDVLFNLLGFLVESGKEMASIKDVLTGETPSTAPVGTTLALIEQGLQVFTSIYKRIHRALKRELKLLARLNYENVSAEAYTAFFDEPADPQADYNPDDMDILPISDPQSVTKMQSVAKAQAEYQLAKENPELINLGEALSRVYEAIGTEEIEKLIKQPDPKAAQFMEIMQRLEVEGRLTEITEKWSKALKNVADAEAAEEGMQMSFYDMMLRTIQAEISGEQAEQQQNAALPGQGGIPGMEGSPGNAGGLPAPQGPGGPVGPDAGGFAGQQPGGAPGPMGGGPAPQGPASGAL